MAPSCKQGQEVTSRTAHFIFALEGSLHCSIDRIPPTSTSQNGVFYQNQFFSNAFLRARGLWCPMLLDQDFGGSFLVIVYCWAFSCRVQGSRVFQLASQRENTYRSPTFNKWGASNPLPLLRKRCRLSRRKLQPPRNGIITKYHYHRHTIANMFAISWVGLGLPSDGIRNSQFQQVGPRRS